MPKIYWFSRDTNKEFGISACSILVLLEAVAKKAPKYGTYISRNVSTQLMKTLIPRVSNLCLK